MYICLCNQLKDTHISLAREDGAGTVGEVFRALGCAPQCGKCVPYLRESMTDCCSQSIISKHAVSLF